MVKTTGNLDSIFWNLQRNSPAKVVNATAGQVLGFQRRGATRRQKNRLRQQTGFPAASIFWQGLTEMQKEDWSNVGQGYGLTGWQVFLQRGVEQWKRGPVELGAYSYGGAFYGYGSDEENLDPGTLANYKAGKMEIKSPEGVVKITQDHPNDYLIRRRIGESKQVFESAAVHEELVLPLTIGVSYNIMTANETANPEARFYAKIKCQTESGIVYDEQGFTLELDNGWQRDTLIISETVGTILDYSIEFSFSDFDGTVAFDNVEASYLATNWAIDPACNDVAPEYLTQWGDINKTWHTESEPSAVVITTIFIDELTLP